MDGTLNTLNKEIRRLCGQISSADAQDALKLAQAIEALSGAMSKLSSGGFVVRGFASADQD